MKNHIFKSLLSLAIIFFGLAGIVFGTRSVIDPTDIYRSLARGGGGGGGSATSLYYSTNTDVGVADVGNSTFQVLGSFPTVTVRVLKGFSGKLYVGLTDGRVLAYDGSNWQTIADEAYAIRSMEVYDNRLFVSGGQYVKSYDGVSWTDLGYQGEVVADMEVYNSKLFVAVDNTCVKSYSQGAWSDEGCLPSVPQAPILGDMAVYNNQLILADRGYLGRVYIYDGSNYTQIGSLKNGVLALLAYNGKLYAGVQDYSVSPYTGEVHVYGGGGWTNLGVVVQGFGISDMATDGNKLYVGDGLGVVKRLNEGSSGGGRSGSGSTTHSWTSVLNFGVTVTDIEFYNLAGNADSTPTPTPTSSERPGTTNTPTPGMTR